MKVIFVFTKSITFNIFLKKQAEYFMKNGLKVELACSDVKALNFNNILKHQIDFPITIKELFNPKKYINSYLQVKNLVKNNESSIFYLHTPVASHLFRIINFFNKLKIVYFVHGFRFTKSTNIIKKFVFKLIEKILSLKTNIFITINKEDYNYAKLNLCKKALSFKIKGIGLNLNNSHFKKRKLKKKNNVKKILVIAAYKNEKGYPEILKVAETLKKEKIKIDCDGYGNYYKYKLNNISFRKFDVNLKNKIKNYDLLLHLSKREGLPVSVMQCLSEGLPVICYDIRGNNDLVQDEINGFFIKSYKEVLNRIFYLNLNPDIYSKIRLNAFRSINEEFSERQINLNIYKIIKKNFKKQ